MKKALFLSSILMSLSLCSCGGSATSSKEQEPSPINVFIMGGQSNMEGNTLFDDGHDWLNSALGTLGIDDGECCFEGITEIQTSFYGGGHWMIGTNSMRGTNTEDLLKGKFVDTKVGLGAGDGNQMGPELGAAYFLRDYATNEAPIYLIKAAFGGSSLEQSGSSWGWDANATNGKSLYKDQFKVFVENNLQLIEESEGRKPTIKGFLWHQGENDCTAQKAAQYKERLQNLVGAVRADFAPYAVDEDGENIAFIDCYIYDKGDQDSINMPSGATLAVNKALNAAKKEFSEEGEMNFIVNSSWQEPDGLKLQIETGSGASVGGGNGTQHYYTKDMFILGQAYADIIIDNALLD